MVMCWPGIDASLTWTSWGCRDTFWLASACGSINTGRWVVDGSYAGSLIGPCTGFFFGLCLWSQLRWLLLLLLRLFVRSADVIDFSDWLGYINPD